MFARLLLALVVVIAPAVIWGTSGSLPPAVASHFAASGVADGWMPRGVYLVVTLVLATLLPLVIAVTTGLVPHLSRRPKLMRDPEYWFAPARRDATEAFLRDHACRLGTLLSAFMVALHLAVVDANRSTPAQLAMPTFYALLGTFAVLFVVWIGVLGIRFRTPA